MTRLYYSAIAIIGALAVFILFKVYLENRSLFIDELNLARNIAALQYGDFFGPLNYEQYAPPLFLILLKALSSLFGQHEYVLRLIPFLAGLGALGLFIRYFKRYSGRITFFYGLALFAFSLPLMRYSTEVKQYAVDLFLCMLALVVAEHYQGKSTKDYILWMAIGIIGVWLSMPFVFLISGVGLMLLYNSVKLKSSLIWPIVTIALWILSFGLLWYIVLVDPISSDYLKNYHNNYFLKLSFSEELFDQLTGIFRNITCKSAISIAFSMSFFVVGVMVLFRNNKPMAFLWVTPILAMLVASALEQYSIMERLMLFSFPLFYLILFFGFDAGLKLIEKRGIYWRGVFHLWAILTVVISLSQRSSLHYLTTNYTMEEGRDVWQKLVAELNDEPVIITHNAVPAYDYYTNYYKYKMPVKGNPVIIASWSENITWVCDSLQVNSDKVWIFDTHSFGQTLQAIEEQSLQCGLVINEIQGVEARAWLIDLTK